MIFQQRRWALSSCSSPCVAPLVKRLRCFIVRLTTRDGRTWPVGGLIWVWVSTYCYVCFFSFLFTDCLSWSFGWFSTHMHKSLIANMVVKQWVDVAHLIVIDFVFSKSHERYHIACRLFQSLNFVIDVICATSGYTGPRQLNTYNPIYFKAKEGNRDY